jgi:hypothetical protein
MALVPPPAEAPFRVFPAFVPYRNHSGPPVKESIAQMTGAGVCLLDYDLDGDPDLFFPDGRSPEAPDAGDLLFRNQGGLGFAEVSASAGVHDRGWAGGCAVGDVDNDGDPDLYVTHQGPNAFYLNNADGTFTPAGRDAGVDHPGWSTGAGFGDLDGDGLLDLYVCNYIDLERASLAARCDYFGIEVFCGPNGLPGAPDALFRSRDGRRFDDVTREAGVYSPDTRGLSVLLADLSGDGLPEIHVANDATIDLVFANRGGFRFEDVSLLSGAGYSGSGVEQSGMGSAAGDVDSDLDLDLYVTNFQRDYNTLYRNQGRLLFTDVTSAAGLSLPTLHYLGWGTHFLDADNDGDLDIFVANGHIYPELLAHPELGEPYYQNNQIFIGDGAGSFREVATAANDPLRSSRGTAVGDLDDDGRLDVVVNNIDDAPDLYRGVSGGRSIRIHLVGTESNRDGLGAVVTATAGGRRQHREHRLSDGYLGSNEPRLHFGLGSRSGIEGVEVGWPSGRKDLCPGLTAGKVYLVREGVGCLP